MPDDLSAHLIAAGVELVTAEGTDAARASPRRYFPTRRELLAVRDHRR